MQKILLLVVAVAAVAYANEIAARESARESEREALSAGNRERVGLRAGSGLRAGDRLSAKHGSGDRLSAGNRFGAERFNNHKEFSDFDAVDDFAKSNSLKIAIAHENDVASHQAVKKSDGLYHSDGEKIMKDERLDAEEYDKEEFDKEDFVEKKDDLAIDAADEDVLQAQAERRSEHDSFFDMRDGGWGFGGGFGHGGFGGFKGGFGGHNFGGKFGMWRRRR